MYLQRLQEAINVLALLAGNASSNDFCMIKLHGVDITLVERAAINGLDKMFNILSMPGSQVMEGGGPGETFRHLIDTTRYAYLYAIEHCYKTSTHPPTALQK